MKRFHLIMMLLIATPAFAREDVAMISNGQGISSPSFWQGLTGQNPAGLVFNQTLKIQAAGASYDDSASKNNVGGSGALLYGNSLLGVGLEGDNNYGTSSVTNRNRLNWGLAGRIPSLGLTVGVSSHQDMRNGGNLSYDAGALFELGARSRVALMIPGVNHFVDGRSTYTRVVAAGITLKIDNNFDFVVDGEVLPQRGDGMLKPGITIHTETVEMSGAYGLRVQNDVSGSSVYEGFSGAFGLKLTRNILIEYGYQVFARHLLGLTLRLN